MQVTGEKREREKNDEKAECKGIKGRDERQGKERKGEKEKKKNGGRKKREK